jgi:hypothetical protein
MPKFEFRCNTERVLMVEADDEPKAREIAEQTDFSDWDSLDSPYAIELIDKLDQPVEPVNQSVGAYTLRIDGQLFRRQRQLLLKILDAVSRHERYVPAASDAELLEGATALLDEIADQAHDQHGVDCLLDGNGGNS